MDLGRKQLIQNELEELREREATTAIQNQRLTDSIVELEKVWVFLIFSFLF